jgi:hypothetical protein
MPTNPQDKRPKPNALISVAVIDKRLVLYIHPTTWQAAIELSRYYLLHEDGCAVDSGAYGPVFGGFEYNEPIECLMLDLLPKSKRAKAFFEKLKTLKMPREPRRKQAKRK